MIIQVRHRFRHMVCVGKWLFTSIALAFLVMAVWKSQLLILNTLAHSMPVYLILSVLVWMAAHLLSPVFSYIVLNGCGVKVEYRQILDLHLRYLPARYIPGGVWHTVGRVSGLHYIGVDPRHLSSLVIFENLVAVGVALTAGGGLIGLQQYGRSWQPVAMLTAVVSLVILVSCPIFVNRFILKPVVKICYRNYTAAVMISIIFWFFATTSFLLFIFSLPNSFTISTWPEIAGAYLFSWGMGYIAIFAPQGVGVFEVVAANIIPTHLAFSAVVALLAGFRLVVILADVLMWGGWAVWMNIGMNFKFNKVTRS